MATKTATQQINVSVGLTDDKVGVSDAKKVENIATIFEVFNNQDAKARSQIEKEMMGWYVWVDVPKGTKTVEGKSLTEGWNTLALGGENKEVYFSDRAIDAINKEPKGLPVGLGYGYGWPGVLAGYGGPNGVARVAVAGSKTGPEGVASQAESTTNNNSYKALKLASFVKSRVPGVIERLQRTSFVDVLDNSSEMNVLREAVRLASEIQK